MLARVAENVFWLSRYLERAESTVRLMYVHGNHIMDRPDLDEAASWIPLISVSGADSEFAEHFDKVTEDNVSQFLLADKRNAGSLHNTVKAIRYNLRSSRDTMPRRLYEAINDLYLFVDARVTRGLPASQRREFLYAVEQRLLIITGISQGSQRHDLGYLIMLMGCYLERADMTSRILDVHSAMLPSIPISDELQLFENQDWVAVLNSVNAVQMYRHHVRKPVQGPEVLKFLLTDPALPRAYRFCLNELADCLKQLDNSSAALDALKKLQAMVDNADIPALAEKRTELHDYLDSLQIGSSAVADAITTSYFPKRTDPA